MSNFLVDAIGNIERDYDPDIKESAKTEKLKFTEPKLSDEVRYDTNIPYDKIGKIDSYIDKYESETLKVSDSLSFSKYDELNKGKEVVSVTEGMSQHATEVYEKLKMEHKELSYSEKDKVLFIENAKKEFFTKDQLEKLPDIDEKLGKIYDDVANNIEKLPPEYGISMNKAITEYKEMLNMQTGNDPEAIKNILTMHYNNLIKQLKEEKILTGPELEKLQELDQEAINYYNKKYVDSDKGEVEETKFKENKPKEEYLTTKLNANEQGVKTKPTPPREGFTLSNDSLLSDENGVNSKYNKDKIDALGNEKTGLSEKLELVDEKTKKDVNTASYDSLVEDKVMEYDGGTEKPEEEFKPKVSDVNKYDKLLPDQNNRDSYQVINTEIDNRNVETYAEPTTFNPDVKDSNSYEKLTHKNDNEDNYQVINNPGLQSTYAEATTNQNDTRSNNIYMQYIAHKEGIPEDYGKEENEKDFWDYYANLDFSSTTSMITSGASELAKLKFGESITIDDREIDIEDLENYTKNVLERTGVDIMINNSAVGRVAGGIAFYADLAAKIIQNKDKLTFENYLFATTYLYYLTPIRPDIGPSGYNKSGKDWSILGYTEGGIGAKINSVAKNGVNTFLSTVTGGLYQPESNDTEGYGASKFIENVYDSEDLWSNQNIDQLNLDLTRVRQLDFTDKANKTKKGITFTEAGNNYLFTDNDELKYTSSIFEGTTDKGKRTSTEELHVQEISDEILFKGRSVIKAAEENGFMINNQFNWDIKIEPLFDISAFSNGDDLNIDLLKKYCNWDNRYNVPNLANYFGPNWLPVTDFNVNFSTNSVNQVQIGIGINIPVFNKVEFPSTLSMSVYESHILALKKWLYDYQECIYGVHTNGGSLTRPYQFSASKCSIYLWSVAPINEKSNLYKALNTFIDEPTGRATVNSMKPNTNNVYNDYQYNSKLVGILRKYILYIIPINFDFQINGASAPSLESKNLNFTIVGSETGYSLVDPFYAVDQNFNRS